MADAMIEAFQRERNEWHSAAIREILGEYETWRQSSSQVPAGDVERFWPDEIDMFRELRKSPSRKLIDLARTALAVFEPFRAALAALQVTEGDMS
jgi:hypothetical protein